DPERGGGSDRGGSAAAAPDRGPTAADPGTAAPAGGAGTRRRPLRRRADAASPAPRAASARPGRPDHCDNSRNLCRSDPRPFGGLGDWNAPARRSIPLSTAPNAGGQFNACLAPAPRIECAGASPLESFEPYIPPVGGREYEQGRVAVHRVRSPAA